MDMDIITGIEKFGSNVIAGFEHYQGYVITTTQQVIRVFISSYEYCSEEFDVDIILPDGCSDINSLIGQHVTHVKWAYAKNKCTDRYEAGVDVHTAIGLVKLVAWNDHNGYYPHTVKVTWKDHEEEQDI